MKEYSNMFRVCPSGQTLSMYNHFVNPCPLSRSHSSAPQRDMLPPLSLTLRSGGFLFDSPIGLSISRLSPRAPRFSEQPFRAGCLFLFPYAVIRSLRPSSRIFTAAFTSLSIQFPHPQRYIRSSRRSSFFTFPHLLHILLDGKNRSTFTSSFP